MEKEEKGAFTGGGILSILGIMAIAFTHDLQAGFLLLGLGVVFMASSSPERAQEFFEFIFSIFRGLVDFALNR